MPTQPKKPKPCACDEGCVGSCTTYRVFAQGHDQTVRGLLNRDRRHANTGECHDPARCERVDWFRVNLTFWNGDFEELIKKHRLEAASRTAG